MTPNDLQPTDAFTIVHLAAVFATMTTVNVWFSDRAATAPCGADRAGYARRRFSGLRCSVNGQQWLL